MLQVLMSDLRTPRAFPGILIHQDASAPALALFEGLVFWEQVLRCFYHYRIYSL